MELYQTMDQFEGKGEVDFPAWWQNKINTAGNMLSSAKHYLDFELKEPQIDTMVGVGNAMNEEINQSNLQGELTQAFAQLKPKVEVYGNNGEVKFQISNDVNQNTFNSVINYLEGNNFVVDREQSYPDYEQDDDREWFPRIRFTIKGPNTGNSLPNLGEKKLTPTKKIAEELAKKLKEARFEKGEDVGEPGKGFSKIEKAAAKKYGSEEAGKRVAGAILKKVLKK